MPVGMIVEAAQEKETGDRLIQWVDAPKEGFTRTDPRVFCRKSSKGYIS